MKLRAEVIMVLCCALLFGCGGGGGGSASGGVGSGGGGAGGGNADPAGPAVTGGVVKGPALGSTVCAFSLSAGVKGTPIPVSLATGAIGSIKAGCYVTTADGRYSFTLPAGITGDILVEATGGTFCTDESVITNGACSQGGTIASLSSTVMTAAVTIPASGNASLYITPLTTAAVNAAGPNLSAAAFVDRFTTLAGQVIGAGTSVTPSIRPTAASQPYLAQVASYMQQGGTLHAAITTLGKGSTTFPADPTTPTDPTNPTDPTGPTDPVTQPLVASQQEPYAVDWSMFRGGASHTGYAPVSISAAGITQAWQWQASLPDKPAHSVNKPQIRPIAAADGRFFVTTGIWYYKHQQIYAVDLATGAQLWNKDLGESQSLDPPSVADGKVVFVENTGQVASLGFIRHVHFLSAQNGAALGKATFSAQDSFAAPTIRNEVVYGGCDTYGGLCTWDLQSMQFVWGHNGMAQTSYWTPAVDDNQIYAYAPPTCAPQYGCLPSGLYIYEKAAGDIIGYIPEEISIQRNALRGDFFTAPIIGPHGNILVYGAENTTSTRSAIASFDVVNKKRTWKVFGNYQGQPALARGVVYALNQDPMRIEAIDESTGAVLWTAAVTAQDEGAYVGNVIATDTSLIFSTNKQVYVFDLNSKSVVWTYPSAGEVAITPNGYMLISLATKVPDLQWLGADRTKPALTNGTIVGFRLGGQ